MEIEIEIYMCPQKLQLILISIIFGTFIAVLLKMMIYSGIELHP